MQSFRADSPPPDHKNSPNLDHQPQRNQSSTMGATASIAAAVPNIPVPPSQSSASTVAASTATSGKGGTEKTSYSDMCTQSMPPDGSIAAAPADTLSSQEDRSYVAVGGSVEEEDRSSGENFADFTHHGSSIVAGNSNKNTGKSVYCTARLLRRAKLLRRCLQAAGSLDSVTPLGMSLFGLDVLDTATDMES